MKNTLVWEIVGWYGMLAILSAYFLHSFSITHAANFWYQFLNATGSMGIVIVSYRKKAYQPMALNVAWTLISLVAFGRLILGN